MMVLYGTQGCHLCDLADMVCEQAGVLVEKVDIALDDNLYARYGVRIPVLKNTVNEQELGWPFDVQQVKRFNHE